MDGIRQLKTLKVISPGDGRKCPVEEFLKRLDAGEFKK